MGLRVLYAYIPCIHKCVTNTTGRGTSHKYMNLHNLCSVKCYNHCIIDRLYTEKVIYNVKGIYIYIYIYIYICVCVCVCVCVCFLEAACSFGFSFLRIVRLRGKPSKILLPA